jgi:hypothetical protein
MSIEKEREIERLRRELEELEQAVTEVGKISLLNSSLLKQPRLCFN